MALRSKQLINMAEKQKAPLRAAKAEEMKQLVEKYPFLEVYRDSIPKPAGIKEALKKRMLDGILILFD